jgi:hypothetical protein
MNWKAFGRNRLLPPLRTTPTLSAETEENHKESQSGTGALVTPHKYESTPLSLIQPIRIYPWIGNDEIRT